MTTTLDLPRGAEPSQGGTLALRVTGLLWEADGIVSVLLGAPDGGRLPEWRPGAHIDVELAPDLVRQYSLTSDPADPRRYRITVARDAASRGGSRHVHDSLRVGEILTVRGPRDDFGFVPAPRYLFVAGGIGITPLLPMIAQARSQGRPWELHHAVRTRAAAAFGAELDALDTGGAVHRYVDDEARPLDLATVLARAEDGTAVYCCGPEPMLAEAETRAQTLGLDLHVERFRPKAMAEPVQAGAFTVRCARSQRTVTVEPDQSVLAALTDAGVQVDSSCREGVCGTCEVAVLSGRVEHRDSLLTAAEKEANETMMVCVSRALTEELELDV